MNQLLGLQSGHIRRELKDERAFASFMAMMTPDGKVLNTGFNPAFSPVFNPTEGNPAKTAVNLAFPISPPDQKKFIATAQKTAPASYDQFQRAYAPTPANRSLSPLDDLTQSIAIPLFKLEAPWWKRLRIKTKDWAYSVQNNANTLILAVGLSLFPGQFDSKRMQRIFVSYQNIPDILKKQKFDYLYKTYGVNQLYFPTPDGVVLHGWQLKAPPNRPTVVYSLGRSADVSRAMPMFEAAAKSGYGLFVYNYRGTGESQGSPTEEGLYQDLEGAVDTLHRIGVPYQDQILLGTSLGSIVTANIVGRHPERPFKSVILTGSMRSMSDVIAERTANTPKILHPLIRRLSNHLIGQFDIQSNIPKITRPLMLVYAEKDEITPPKETLLLHESAKQSPNIPLLELAVLKDVGHVGMLHKDSNEVFKLIDGFIRRVDSLEEKELSNYGLPQSKNRLESFVPQAISTTVFPSPPWVASAG